jgi:hypothetical protein
VLLGDLSHRQQRLAYLGDDFTAGARAPGTRESTGQANSLRNQ